jgi:C4-dicarboxylate transporter DctM subunit
MTALGFVVLLLLGMPIAFVLGITALLFVPALGVDVLLGFPQRMFVGVNKSVLMAIPFFLLAGSLMNEGGITRRLLKFAQGVVGWVHGGLAMTNIFASMIFAGVSGSAQADAAALGKIMIPAMEAEGYDREYACGVVASAAVIGPIIPPSIIMVILAVAGDLSIGALFLGGVVPGVLIGLALMVVAYAIARARGYPRGARPHLRELLTSAVDAGFALLMPVIVLGGILTGVFTATEAAAIAVLYALLVGLLVYKELRIRDLPRLLLETAVMNCAVMFVFATAYLLSWVITFADVPFVVGDWIRSVGTTPVMFLLVVNLLLLFVGLWMDPGAAAIVLLPILLPIAEALGIHPVHFGLVVTINLVIGMITPPVGYVLYTLAPVVRVSIEQISRGVLPFLAVEILVLFFVTYSPWTTLTLPRFFGFVR